MAPSVSVRSHFFSAIIRDIYFVVFLTRGKVLESLYKEGASRMERQLRRPC